MCGGHHRLGGPGATDQTVGWGGLLALAECSRQVAERSWIAAGGGRSALRTMVAETLRCRAVCIHVGICDALAVVGVLDVALVARHAISIRRTARPVLANQSRGWWRTACVVGVPAAVECVRRIHPRQYAGQTVQRGVSRERRASHHHRPRWKLHRLERRAVLECSHPDGSQLLGEVDADEPRAAERLGADAHDSVGNGDVTQGRASRERRRRDGLERAAVSEYSSSEGCAASESRLANGLRLKIFKFKVEICVSVGGTFTDGGMDTFNTLTLKENASSPIVVIVDPTITVFMFGQLLNASLSKIVEPNVAGTANILIAVLQEPDKQSEQDILLSSIASFRILCL